MASPSSINILIVQLYLEDGRTQQRIADLMGLSIGLINGIVDNFKSENTDNASGDKRRKIKEKDYPTIARLILGGDLSAERMATILWWKMICFSLYLELPWSVISSKDITPAFPD